MTATREGQARRPEPTTRRPPRLPRTPAAATLGPSAPLDPATRAEHEQRLGWDLSDVVVHRSPEAAASAVALGARAYTLGRSMVFAPGEYRPGTPTGRDLLDHELTHIVEQGTGAAPVSVQRQAMSGDWRAIASRMTLRELEEAVLRLREVVLASPVSSDEQRSTTDRLAAFEKELTRRQSPGPAPGPRPAPARQDTRDVVVSSSGDAEAPDREASPTAVSEEAPASAPAPVAAAGRRPAGSAPTGADEGVRTAAQAECVAEPSGAQWVARFPTSRDTRDLEKMFGRRVDRFIDAMRTGNKVGIHISATLRPPERAYLMHYSWRIARQNFDPARVPPKAGVGICWLHRDAGGNPDVAASRAAAESMVNTYRIVHRPALRSRHTAGLAIDMSIWWSGNLRVSSGETEGRTITSKPRNGAKNTELHAVGAEEFQVYKLVGDAPHWSSDGH